MNILIITQTFPKTPTDHTAHFMYDFAAGFAENGHSVFVLLPYTPELQPSDFDYMHIIPFRYMYPEVLQKIGFGRTLRNDQTVPLLMYFLTPFFLFFEIIATILAVRRFHIDIMNPHWIIPNGFCAAVASRFTGVPYVVTLPGSDVYLTKTHNSAKLMAHYAAAGARKIISNSPQLLKDLRVIGPVISYGVPAATGKRTVHKNMIISTAGRPVEKKGIALVQSVYPDVQVLTGLTIGDFRKKLLSTDIFIAFSVRDSSGNLDDASLTVLEAMAAGCAVITSDLPGYRRIIRTGINGVLVPAGNTKALSRALTNLVASKALRQKIGNAAADTIRGGYTPRQTAGHYLALFRRAITT